MGIILVILGLLVVILAPILFIKRKASPSKQIIGPSGTRRRRDGALTYDEYRGMRFNATLEDPRDSHSPRYQRRHSTGQHKQTKPWMK